MELIGGGTSTEDVSWQDLDARDPVQPCGQLTVASISTRGGSPFTPSGVLSDAVPLTGRTLSYPIATIAVRAMAVRSIATSEMAPTRSPCRAGADAGAVCDGEMTLG